MCFKLIILCFKFPPFTRPWTEHKNKRQQGINLLFGKRADLFLTFYITANRLIHRFKSVVVPFWHKHTKPASKRKWPLLPLKTQPGDTQEGVSTASGETKNKCKTKPPWRSWPAARSRKRVFFFSFQQKRRRRRHAASGEEGRAGPRPNMGGASAGGRAAESPAAGTSGSPHTLETELLRRFEPLDYARWVHPATSLRAAGFAWFRCARPLCSSSHSIEMNAGICAVHVINMQ